MQNKVDPAKEIASLSSFALFLLKLWAQVLSLDQNYGLNYSLVPINMGSSTLLPKTKGSIIFS